MAAIFNLLAKLAYVASFTMLTKNDETQEGIVLPRPTFSTSSVHVKFHAIKFF